MHNRRDDAKADLISKAAAVVRRSPPGAAGSSLTDPGAFLQRYYRHTAPDDLLARDPADVAGAAISHYQLAEHRPQGTALVRVLTPTRQQSGWSTGHTVVEIVTDDMPFLVDSVTAELSNSERRIRLVVHPQLVVRRDVTGRLLELLDLSESDSDALAEHPDAVVESWMHVEIARTDDGGLEPLEASLTSVLRDVREAVEDWSKMRERAEELARQVDDAGSVDGARRTEAVDFLQWLADDHFTFLGYREYSLEQADGHDALHSVTGSGLGILRSDPDQPLTVLPAPVAGKAREKNVLILTKANSRATVHRPAYLDYVGVKRFDEHGEVVGESRFLGLFTSAAYTQSVRRIPVLAGKAREVLRRSGFVEGSHSAKDLLQVLETYPRDELFQISVDELYPIVESVLYLQERRQLRLFVRRDVYGRYLSCLVYFPRDRYNTDVRERMQDILLRATGGRSITHTARVAESVLARLHFVIRMAPGSALPDVDEPQLERELTAATRDWVDDLEDALVEQLGEERGTRLASRYARGIPEAYKEDFPARSAVSDIEELEALDEPDGIALSLYREPGRAGDERRLKIFRTGDPISLTRVLPLLTEMGVEIVDERPYELQRSDGHTVWVYDFGLRTPGLRGTDATLAAQFSEALLAVWHGQAESDGFNALVLTAGLSWRQVVLLRAYARYVRQTGSTYSQSYLQEVLVANTSVARGLVTLFQARFDPDRLADPELRSAAVEEIAARIEAELDDVVSLDQDRILRGLLGLVHATLRTNYYQRTGDGEPKTYVSFKLDSRKVPDLPQPRPYVEVWVYSPRVEGVHLRFGPVARGGLRWSDRREDFRTEVLGLVKAQAVKNSVIVPVGAKGGFVAKALPDPADREAWLAEGIASYKTFIRGLLDLTDNRTPAGEVLHPERVIRHDGDDTYLVVAADKGTATFSDIANEVSREYGFWLGDAFASGGSAGYDHKSMGITARGAWESVQRHFREMGRDCQREDFTAVGVGDMSGDVFGNGMLLSRRTRLVAAFDHRHIFLDPDPDAATSWAERKRLFDLPRSSWADYEYALISAGGGIYPRSAKSVPVSPPVARVLGLGADARAMAPAELMKAILAAPVDLLWNGGIGTYVKASSESHADVGDKANDAIRVDGSQLRAQCVGEGGNLGLTQLGRIEYALRGGRINTDAIDNSAGVDTSDHEVNIKILLEGAVRAGDLREEQRDDLLAAMTDEVAALVLANNYGQNVALANALAQAPSLLHVHRAHVRSLEAAGKLDRILEFLPSERGFAERQAAGLGLVAPELAVLLAYTKNVLFERIIASDLPDDPALRDVLHGYFPSALRGRYAEQIDAHPLRREIVTTVLVNDVVNDAGTTFAFRLGMETGSDPAELMRAQVVSRVIFDTAEAYAAVSALDTTVPARTLTHMRLELRKVDERSTRWLAMNRRPPLDIDWQIGFFDAAMTRLLAELPDALVGVEHAAYEARRDQLLEAGVPKGLASRIAVLPPAYSGLGVVETSVSTGTDVMDVARVHFALGEELALGRFSDRILELPRADRWQTMARAALRDDLHAVHTQLTSQVLLGTQDSPDAAARVAAWESTDAAAAARARQLLGELVEGEADLARLSVGLRVVRGLVRQQSPG